MERSPVQEAFGLREGDGRGTEQILNPERYRIPISRMGHPRRILHDLYKHKVVEIWCYWYFLG